MPATGTVIAILGAESTGKTTLARSLAAALRALGREALVVPEFLREFCDRERRTPTPHEQAGIADTQARRIAAAARDAPLVLADTTPLMTAVYSEWVFGDRGLYAPALAFQREACHATLLTGLDLPWQPDGLQRDGPQVRAPVDRLVRGALARAGCGYAVVYGTGEARTAHALAALRPLLALPPPTSAPDSEAASADRPLRLRGRCRECLVPECEHLAALLPTTAP